MRDSILGIRLHCPPIRHPELVNVAYRRSDARAFGTDRLMSESLRLSGAGSRRRVTENSLPRFIDLQRACPIADVRDRQLRAQSRLPFYEGMRLKGPLTA